MFYASLVTNATICSLLWFTTYFLSWRCIPKEECPIISVRWKLVIICLWRDLRYTCITLYFVCWFCLFPVWTYTLDMLNFVLSHEAYFGLDFCFIYNLLELLSIIRHHTCHSVVVHNNKKNGPVTFLPSFLLHWKEAFTCFVRVIAFIIAQQMNKQQKNKKKLCILNEVESEGVFC